MYLDSPLENRQVYGYKPDGNTVVLHRWKVRPVFGNLWIRETQTDQYNQEYAPLCVFLPGVKYGLQTYTIGGYTLREKTAVEIANLYGKDTHTQTALENLFSEQMASGGWIKNSEVQFVRQFNPSLADRMQEYHDRKTEEREEQSRQWAENRRKREEEEKAAREREIADAIRKASQTILEGKEMQNETIHGKSLVNLLLDHYEIPVPLRTRGWIIESLASIQIPENGPASLRFRKRTKTSKASNTIWDLLYQLNRAIRA